MGRNYASKDTNESCTYGSLLLLQNVADIASMLSGYTGVAMKNRKIAGKKYEKHWDGQEGLLTYVIPQLILELRDEDLRENALRCLSGLLHDVSQSIFLVI